MSSIENSILQAADNSIQQNTVQQIPSAEAQPAAAGQTVQPESSNEVSAPQNDANAIRQNEQPQNPVPENGQFDIF